MNANSYSEVSTKYPCEICGYADWCWRTVNNSVLFCRRVLRDDGVECHDKNAELYYRYGKGGPTIPQQAPPSDNTDRVPCGAITTLDGAYRALLSHLPLSQAHWDTLKARGLTPETISRGSYATMPIDPEARQAAIHAVGAVMGDLDMCSVPGFYRPQSGAEIELAGMPGLLIPTRSPEGLIRAVRIRLDDPPLVAHGKPIGKYRYLSAPKGSIGCGPGAQVHVPLHSLALRRGPVRITEGELKAEIATERTGILTISIPGAGTFELAVDIVRQLGGKGVLLAFDADARRNRHVAEALQRCALRFSLEFSAAAVSIEVWAEDAGKGIDDLLVGTRAGELVVHSGSKVWTQISEIARLAGAAVEPMVEAHITLANISDRLAGDPQGTAFAPEVLVAARVLRAHDMPEYERLTSSLKKGGVRIGAWEKAVKSQVGHASGQCAPNRLRLPEIAVSVDEAKVAGEAITALAASEHLYQRGGALVHVVQDGGKFVGVNRPLGTPHIVIVPLAFLREFCSKCARWIHQIPGQDGDTKYVEGHPPLWAVQAVHQRGQWDGIRHLVGVVEWPALRPDGSLLTVAGYDSATGLLYAPNCAVPSVPDVPTTADVRASVALLLEVICDFPFATPNHRAACLAAVLTTLARHAFDGPAPLVLIDKSTRATGGSLLADIISEIVEGRPMARMSPSPNDEEERKRITAIALSGISNVLIDNVSCSLGTPSLDAALTATVWQDRILGASQLVQLPLVVTWFATGNNIPLAADTSRRCLHIRLESPEERPEERTGFKHDPILPWVRSTRPAILAAALTLLRAFVVAGRPSQGLPAWGSFDAWSGLVRDCLVWAGLPDPGVTRLELQASADEATSALGDLVEGWEEAAATFGGGCTVAQAINLLEEDYEKKRFQRLRSAIEELVTSTPGQLPSARRIGAAIKKYRGRVVGGKALEKAGERGEAGNIWTLRVVASPPTSKAPRPPAAASPVSPVSNSASSSNSNHANGEQRSASGERVGSDAGDAGDTGGASGWEERL